MRARTAQLGRKDKQKADTRVRRDGSCL